MALLTIHLLGTTSSQTIMDAALIVNMDRWQVSHHSYHMHNA